MKKILLLLSISLCVFSSKAQISTTQKQKIEQLFTDWKKPNRPGGVITIIKDGKNVFSKAYGLASLEYEIPNTKKTIFNIGSVSKQFTAMGIILLHLKGVLSIDDDIRKHLPDLPDFGEKITIRNMLHHTSGLRSFHALLSLAGWRFDDSRDNDDLDRFMKKQQDLNFKPGNEFGYSNTNYMLMVNIIEKVTKTKFTQWMKESIFEPLGMHNTYIEDDYMHVTQNKATSYYTNRKNQYFRASEYWNYIGSANVHSTAQDLIIWLENFRKPKSGWAAHFKMMTTQDKLNDGTENEYAFGVLVKNYNGIKSVEHSGVTGGYISNIVSFPKENISFVILSNSQNSRVPQKSAAITKLILNEKKPIKVEKKSLVTYKISTKKLKKYEGFYWFDKNDYSRKIYIRNDTLRYSISKNREYALIPIGKDKFKRLDSNVIIDFKLTKNSTIMNYSYNNESPFRFTRYQPIAPSQSEFSLYKGTYYSSEIESTYVISLNDNKLKGNHLRHGDFSIERIKYGILKTRSALGTIKFKKDKKGQITGFFASNGRVINMWFKKQK